MNNILELIPPMLEGDELMEQMKVAPFYDESIRTKSISERLVALNDIYNVYVPSKMTKHIYNKIYLSVVRGLQKKTTKLAQMQRVQNGKTLMSKNEIKNYQSIIGGGDSFTIVGNSGIGKSCTISRAIDLISSCGVIELEEPFARVLPCLQVQCVFDCSIKGMLVEILRCIDEKIGSNYYDMTIVNKKLTIDMLIGVTSQACLNHIGLLLIDEAQNLVKHKNGVNLFAMLTQLINSTGISIAFISTNETIDYFSRLDYLARRTIGLQFQPLDYGEEFMNFCDEIFKYQYVKNKTSIDEKIYSWLYAHSIGVCSTIVSLIKDAQEIAIIEGIEELGITTLEMAYEQRLQMMHTHIEEMAANKLQKIKQTSEVKPKKMKMKQVVEKINEANTIEEMSNIAKKEKIDILEIMKGSIRVLELEVG